MAHKMMWICDICGERSEDNHFVNNYELHTDYCSDVMHIAEGTKKIEICSTCEKGLINMFKMDGESNGGK